MKRRNLTVFGVFTIVAFTVSGCAGGPSLTTGSLFGGSQSAAAAKGEDTSHLTPTARALQVGTASARAIKCGYNFDPATLRSNYLAAEASAGLSVEQLGQVERVYDTGYGGVSKAVTDPQTYCTAEKTATIKADLTRHLAGDYSAKKKVAKADDGLFSGWGDVAPASGPAFGSDAWWESQVQSAGNK